MQIITVLKIPFCVLNEDLAKMLGLDEGPLTAYLYYHSLMLENARLEAEKNV